jgi:maltooligosyltrehalose trehalohydrolase
MREWTATVGAIWNGRATDVRVWAPAHHRVELISAGDVRPLARDAAGYWTGTFADLRPGSLYRYRLNGDPERTFPDPASRFQPEGVHGPSEVIDPSSFRWTDAGWRAPSLADLVLYELHVGTFTPAGTFRGLIDRLDDLASLGVNAIELMPVADFAGARNWGYDVAAMFAPSRAYGRPDDLRALIDAAHARGLAVFLDVVYNHTGPDGAYLNAFSPHYFSEARHSPWGPGVNLAGEGSSEVRRFFIENALHWVREYHVDGLRLDATHAMEDDGPRPFLAELSAAIDLHAAKPALLVAEDHRNLATLVMPRRRGGFGIDAVWADDFHHQVRVHTAHDDEGYYADFSGSTEDIAATLRQGWFYTGQIAPSQGTPRGTDAGLVRPEQCVICLQNHDQIGNRADGARLTDHIDLATYRALSVLLLLAPQTPLLFMGQEWAATTPFLFFTDHHAELGRQITRGRREEFRSFTAFADPRQRAAIPDPQEPCTFARSRLDWAEGRLPPHAAIRRLYRRLLRLRAALRPAVHDRGDVEVHALDAHTLQLILPAAMAIVRLSGAETVPMPAVPGPVLLSTEDSEVADDPQPIRVTGTSLVFARPGALVMSMPLATTHPVTSNRQ